MSKRKDGQERGKYTLEFKLEAVRLVKGGQAVPLTAKILGVPTQTLGNWVRLIAKRSPRHPQCCARSRCGVGRGRQGCCRWSLYRLLDGTRKLEGNAATAQARNHHQHMR